tara:strand:- start:1334 stop:1501 length:168 start_codon:yes stop_codon:yes gene_type:complete
MKTIKMKRYYVTDDYGTELDVSTSENDLSQKVKCICNDTNEVIYVNGWDVEWNVY